MSGEIFHANTEFHIDSKVLKNIDLNIKESNPIQFVNQFFNLNFNRKALGFKIFEGHNNAALDYLLKNREIKKIILYRENYLAMYSSLLIANKLNYWNDSNLCDILDCKISFDKKEFIAFYNYYSECYDNWSKVINDNWMQDYLLIKYNPRDSMCFATKEVLKFLSLCEKNFTISDFKKLNSTNILSRFDNPSNVLEFLTEINKLEWTDEK